MYNVSAGFLAGLAESHTVLSRVEILSNGLVIQEVDTHYQGEVSFNKSAKIRRTGTVSVLDPDGTLTPAVNSTGPVSPYGNEIRLWRGIRWYSGSTPTDELVPMGTFRIGKLSVADTTTGKTLHITGYDRSRTISRNRFTDPYTIAEGTNVITAIQALISNRLPGLTYAFPSAGAVTNTTPLTVVTEKEDPWEVARGLAEGVGYELFFDGLGICTMRPEPDPLTTPVSFTYEEGEASTLVDVNRTLDDELGYNVAVYIGESVYATPPVRGVARDTNPSSPTYYLGPYGSVPIFAQSQFVTTQGQADEAAQALLLRSIGVPESVVFNAIPNPAHTEGDVVRVVRASSNIDSVHVLDTLKITLQESGLMSCAARARKVTV